jgi:membrane associated rhomboid family serine protease
MGYQDRSYSYSYATGYGGGGGRFGFVLTTWVKRLLIANFGIWLLMVLGILPFLWTVNTFGFSPATVLRHPWSPVTYMFVHGGFWHVFFNMVAVFFFGPPLEREWGGREFIKFYLVCGLGAAFTSFLLIGLIGSPLVIGASGAVFGLMLAFAMKWPNAPLYIWGLLPVKAKYFVGILAVMTFYATFTSGRTGGGGVAHWTHLGGFVTAWIYMKHGRRIESRLGPLKARLRGLKVHSGRTGERSAGAGQASEPPRRPGRDRPVDQDKLDEVDRILDKIRDKGIDSLSPEERAFLDDMSRRYRGAQ